MKTYKKEEIEKAFREYINMDLGPILDPIEIEDLDKRSEAVDDAVTSLFFSILDRE